MDATACPCGDDECPHTAADYPWCRPCAEHHRGPECPIDQEGYGLAQCGCRWVDIEDITGEHPSPACAWAGL